MRAVVVTLVMMAVGGSAAGAAGDRQVEGFSSLVSLSGGAIQLDQFSYRGQDQSYLERAGDGAQAITWTTAPVPQDAVSGTVTFAFGVSITGAGKVSPGEHELLLDGKRLVRFTLPVNGDATWTQGDVTLRFDFLSADVYDDLEGVIYLAVPAELVKPGQPAELTVHGLASGSRCFLCVSAITNVLTDPVAHPASNPTEFVCPKPVTEENLQYDGNGPFQLFDRPRKKQGLDTLLGRGRVRPEQLLIVGREKGVTMASQRTIFRDEYTQAEVWRLTDSTQGVVRHDYSAYPAWNANGRLLKLSWPDGLPVYLNMEDGTLWEAIPVINGQWSTTEPDILFGGGEWNGVGAIVAYDIKELKAVRGLGPVRDNAGISPISADGKWVCWREGIQDDATSFGLAAADGSSYKSISLNGGIITEQTPVTFARPGTQLSVQETQGGVHQMYFTRRPDHSVHVGSNCYEPRLFLDRFYLPDGTYPYHQPLLLMHVSWHPEGKFAIFTGLGGIGGFDLDSNATLRSSEAATSLRSARRSWSILKVKDEVEAHTTWTSYDPDWAGASYRSPFAGEILRISMKPDHSVARLAGSCPVNPATTAYDNDEFACLSPDGTKVLFMSTMSGSVNEYLVVAANPRPPELSGAWTEDRFKLTWTPAPLSREIKGYRVYQTEESGRGYRDISGLVTGTSYPVKGISKNDSGFFAVRAQEWSGLISRYSNEVSSRSAHTTTYLEAEACEFCGFKQGFDPEGASDMYYLFVPGGNGACRLTIKDPGGDAVWARVKGKDVAFTLQAGERTLAVPAATYQEWTWRNIGWWRGDMTLSTSSTGFAVDRIILTDARAKPPTGRGPDYLPDAQFQASAPTGTRAKAESPFAATISWDPVPGTRYYNVYAGETPDFTPAQSNLLYSPPGGTEQVVDWGLKPGTTYCYRVVAIDFDGTASRPSQAVALTAPGLDSRTSEIEYEVGVVADGASVESEASASGGRFVKLTKGQSYTLTFAVPVEGDYAIWHRYRGESGELIQGRVTVDGVSEPWWERYDQAALYGQAVTQEWVWHRYAFAWGERSNGILHFTPGEHTIGITVEQPIELDKLAITNDLSFVPEGKLCTF